MARQGESVVLTLRVPPILDRRIEVVARRKRQTKSAVLRQALQNAFGEAPEVDPGVEARRQSLLVSGRASERDVLQFIEKTLDDKGWR
jgi:predicted transcriptional regulator